jgi:hypothetical protein
MPLFLKAPPEKKLRYSKKLLPFDLHLRYQAGQGVEVYPRDGNDGSQSKYDQDHQREEDPFPEILDLPDVY